MNVDEVCKIALVCMLAYVVLFGPCIAKEYLAEPDTDSAKLLTYEKSVECEKVAAEQVDKCCPEACTVGYIRNLLFQSYARCLFGKELICSYSDYLDD